MSSSICHMRRHNILERLGIERSPELVAIDRASLDIGQKLSTLPQINMLEVPGRRCPTCAEKGQTVWVIPGKNCPYCFTEVN